MTVRSTSFLAAMALAAALAAPHALAGQCPVLMEQIDADLADSQLSSETIAEVRKLRQLGEQQHKQGQHGESVATLQKALSLIDSD